MAADPWACLCCGIELADLAEQRQGIERHHYECPGRVHIEDRADVRELKEKLMDSCLRLNASTLRELSLKLLCKRLHDEISELQTVAAARNTPRCPVCASETELQTETLIKENLHEYRCQKCQHEFSRPPLDSCREFFPG